MNRGRHPEERHERGSLEKHLDRAMTKAAERQGKAFLMVSRGKAAGTVFPLIHSPAIIGRSPEAEVSINEQAMSHEHARIQISGDRYSIEDLGSTNGTRVNGERHTGVTRLHSGDSVKAGSTTFTFVSKEEKVPHGTLKLHDDDGERLAAVRGQVAAAPVRALISANAEGDDDGISLTEVVQRVKTYWVYTKRYSWLAATGLCFGIAAGLVQARLNPPPGSAWFEMTLSGDARGSEDNGIEFFVAPESTFKSLPLIKQSMSELGHPALSDADAADIQSQLSLEQVGFNSKLWRGAYEDATSGGAVAFLDKHVSVYVKTEMDKILSLLRDDKQFNQQQVDNASEQLRAAKAALVEFINEHPEAVPRDARDQIANEPSTSTEGSGVARLQARVATLESEVASAIAAFKRRKAEPYQSQAADAEKQAAIELGTGKTEQHPDVKTHQRRAAEMKRQAAAMLASQPSDSELKLDAEVATAQGRLQLARTKLAAAQAQAQTQTQTQGAGPTVAPYPTVSKVQPTVAKLGQGKLRYEELSQRYRTTQVERDQWEGKLKATQRKLDREETAAKARYAIITPPTPQAVSTSRSAIKRAGMGGAVGLILALAAAACLEFRRHLIARGLL
jgi:pSer/pThr/pTyr-binding forkhead associated (FHA) protein